MNNDTTCRKVMFKIYNRILGYYTVLNNFLQQSLSFSLPIIISYPLLLFPVLIKLMEILDGKTYIPKKLKLRKA